MKSFAGKEVIGSFFVRSNGFVSLNCHSIALGEDSFHSICSIKRSFFVYGDDGFSLWQSPRLSVLVSDQVLLWDDVPILGHWSTDTDRSLANLVTMAGELKWNAIDAAKYLHDHFLTYMTKTLWLE